MCGADPHLEQDLRHRAKNGAGCHDNGGAAARGGSLRGRYGCCGIGAQVRWASTVSKQNSRLSVKMSSQWIQDNAIEAEGTPEKQVEATEPQPQAPGQPISAPTPRLRRGVDRHHHPAALRHHHADSGVRHPHGLHGRHPAGGRSSAGGQAGLRPARRASAAICFPTPNRGAATSSFFDTRWISARRSSNAASACPATASA